MISPPNRKSIINNFFSDSVIYYFLALVNESNQHNVIKEPNIQTANTMIALVLVHGITHVSARLTATKKKNEAALISR